MKKRIDNFFAGVLIFLILPLLPIGFEFVINNTVNDSTLFIATAIYSITIGFTSTTKSFFVISIIACFVFSVLYGLSFDQSQAFNLAFEWSIATIVVIFLFSLSERYKFNYINNIPVFSFE